GVTVTEQGAPCPHPGADVLVAGDVPLARARGALDVGRKRREVADVVGDAARNREPGPLPERGRPWMLRAILFVDRHGCVRLPLRTPPMIPEQDANRGRSTRATRRPHATT